MTKKETTSAFLRLLDQIRDYDQPVVFSDFLEIAAAVTGVIYCNDPEKVVDRFGAILSKYREPNKTEKAMRAMYSLIVQAHIERPLEDAFGPIYMEIVTKGSKDALGQVFTPGCISEMMGQMLFDKKSMEDAIQSGRRIAVSDPCCGSGGMFFGAARAIVQQGHDPKERMVAYALDIDRRCCLMTYIQLALEEIPAQIEHKDTLRCNPPWETWEIPYVLRVIP
jgi:type I restriction-modification system DNA methylase subunit